MIICTYFSPNPHLPVCHEAGLISLWMEQCKRVGLEPLVLNEAWAMKHPKFEQLSAKFKALPSINPILYDLACWLRWVALSMAPVEKGELLAMTDYDVMIYDVEPLLFYGTKHRKNKPFTKLVGFQKSIPSLVLGHRALFEQQAIRFSEYELRPDDRHNDVPHISDMYAWERQAQAAPESFTRLELVKQYGEDGWKEACACHFNNGSMVPAGLTPRWKHIKGLR